MWAARGARVDPTGVVQQPGRLRRPAVGPGRDRRQERGSAAKGASRAGRHRGPGSCSGWCRCGTNCCRRSVRRRPGRWDRVGTWRMSATSCRLNVSPPPEDLTTHTPLWGSGDPNRPGPKERDVHISLEGGHLTPIVVRCRRRHRPPRLARMDSRYAQAPSGRGLVRHRHPWPRVSFLCAMGVPCTDSSTARPEPLQQALSQISAHIRVLAGSRWPALS